MRGYLAAALIGAAIMATPANATVLLDQTDKPSVDSYQYSFLTDSALTRVSFAGYAQSGEIVSHVRFIGDNGANLLAQDWNYTPSPAGGASSQAIYAGNNTGTNDFYFASSPSNYDTFYQDVATTPGSSYQLAFDYNPFQTSNNGLRVEQFAAPAGPGAPAPLLGLGILPALAAFGGLFATRAGRRKQATA